jgi:molybdopterin converting factor small subunit
MPASDLVIVEFFGVPRQRSGCAELTVDAGTIAEVLAQVQDRCPKLRMLLDAHGRLCKEYLISINGERFMTDMQERLKPGERLLILSSDAGG